MPNYAVVTSEEPFEINTKTTELLIGCCDCGLVHTLPITVIQKNGKLTHRIRMEYNRNERSTAQLRRKKQEKN